MMGGKIVREMWKKEPDEVVDGEEVREQKYEHSEEGLVVKFSHGDD